MGMPVRIDGDLYDLAKSHASAVGPADFARFLAAESVKWGAVVRKANVKLD